MSSYIHSLIKPHLSLGHTLSTFKVRRQLCTCTSRVDNHAVPFILQLTVGVGLVFHTRAFPDPHYIPVGRSNASYIVCQELNAIWPSWIIEMWVRSPRTHLFTTLCYLLLLLLGKPARSACTNNWTGLWNKNCMEHAQLARLLYVQSEWSQILGCMWTSTQGPQGPSRHGQMTTFM